MNVVFVPEDAMAARIERDQVALKEPQLRAFLAFAQELEARANGDVGSTAVLEGLCQLVKAEGASYNIVDRQARRYRYFNVAPAGAETAPDPAIDIEPELWEFLLQHPLCLNYEKTGDPRPHSMHELFSISQLRRMAIYSHMRTDGIGDILEFGLAGRWPTTRLFILVRDRPFTADERALLDLVRLQLHQLDLTLRARRQSDAALELSAAVPRGAAQGWVALSWATRRLEFVSPTAGALLREFFDIDTAISHALPPVVSSWLRAADASPSGTPLAVAVDGGRVTWLMGRKALTADGDLVAVVSRESLTAARRARSLTTREREVVELVAAGLTNSQIAARLAIAPHTVRKHLENSFAKLGVHTRTAAAFALAEGRAETISGASS